MVHLLGVNTTFADKFKSYGYIYSSADATGKKVEVNILFNSSDWLHVILSFSKFQISVIFFTKSIKGYAAFTLQSNTWPA